MAGINAKTLAWVGVPLLAAGGVHILNTTTQGLLFEIRKSQAAVDEARASNKAAEAQALDAINRLKGTLETAAAMNNVGQLQAKATIEAAYRTADATVSSAQKQADALIAATTESVRAENSQYDSMVAPLMAEPAKKTAQLNTEIVRLKRELQRGAHATTGKALTPAEVTDKTATLQTLEEELAAVQETTAKNWNDAMNMLMGAANSMIGGIGGLYPNSNTPPAPPRRIIQER